ncbi:HNH endonuclease [Atopobiaceae bacterium HCP3S3_F7]|uniref:HNH endonuclease n=1 Tax=Coriobacteriia TaxID=84998 RepID=UPI003F8C7B71
MKPIRFEGVYDPTIWKPVEGAEGYFVNMEGKIKGRRGRVLKGFLAGSYPSVSVGRGKSSLRIHRAVAKAFIGDIPEVWVVNHIDEVKTNANVMNLEICTASHNARHSLASRKPRKNLGKAIEYLSEWKPIPSIPTAMAHPSGRVASLDAQGKLRERLGYVQATGYRRVRVNGKSYYTHRLIAETFCPNPNNFPIVNHIDENKLNNCASNLEWCTYQHNVLHGTARQLATEKLSKPVVAKDSEGNIVYTFKSAAEAIRMGFHPGHISSCCNGRQKTHKGLYWSFA